MSFVIAVTARAFLDYADTERQRLVDAGCTFAGSANGPCDKATTLAVLAGADAVIASVDPYDDEVFEAHPQLQLISRWGAGYESIDLAAATRHGVIATRVVGCLTDAVADHTFALLFAVARRIVEGDVQIRGMGWQPLQGVAVFGKTIGLVGFGPIGQAVAVRAKGFQMRILVHDPYQPDEVLAAHGAERLPLPELLAASDFVSIHTALTPETHQIINAEGLAQMQPHAILINTARGKMVDQDALQAALIEGGIRGAGLDSYDPDPLPADHPFRQTPNCVLMPHSAFNTDESARAVSRMAADAVLAVMAGRAPNHILNPEVLESPDLRAKLGS